MVNRHDVANVRSPNGRFGHVAEVASRTRMYYLADCGLTLDKLAPAQPVLYVKRLARPGPI